MPPVVIGSALLQLLPTDDGEFTDGVQSAVEDAGNSAIGTIGKIGVAAAAAVAAAGAAAIGQGLRNFAEFETAISEVFTLIPDAGVAARLELEAQAKAFSAEFGTPVEEALQGVYDSISAGIPEDNVFAFLESANQLAVGGVTDTNSAIDLLTGTVNTFGLSADSAGAISDSLFTAVRGGKTTIEELAAELGKVAPSANAIGLEFGELNGLMAELTKGGLTTTQASTALNTALNELLQPTSKAAVAFQDLAGQSFQGFIDAGGSVEDAFALVEEAAANAEGGVNALFGTTASQAVNTLLRDGNTLAEQLDAQADAAGAAAAAFEEVDDNLANSLGKLRNGLQLLLLEVGTAVAPAVSVVADFLVDRLPGFLAQVGPAFETFSSTVADVFFGVFNAVSPLVEEFGPAIAELFGGAVLGDLSFVGDIFGTILDAVQPLIPAAQQLFGTFTTAIGQVLPVITSLRETFQEVFLRILDTAITIILPVAVSVLETFVGVIEGLIPLGVELIDQFAQLAEDILPIFANLLESIVPVFESLIELVAETAEDLLPILQDAFADLIPVVEELLLELAAALEEILPPLLEVFAELAGVVLPLLVEIIGVLLPIIVELLEILVPVAAFMTEVLVVAIVAVTDIISGLITALSEVIGFFGNFKENLDKVGEGVNNALGSITGFVTGLPGELKEKFESIVGDFLGYGTGLGENIVDGLKTAVENGTSAVADSVRSIINGLFDILRDFDFRVEFAGFDPPGPGSIPSFSFSFDPFEGLPRLAAGGTFDFVPGGRPVVITERGRETVIPHDDPARAAQVFAESGLASIIGGDRSGGAGGGSTTIIERVEVSGVRDTVDFMESLDEISGGN